MRTLLLQTPVGRMSLTASAEAVVALHFGEEVPAGSQAVAGNNPGDGLGDNGEMSAEEKAQRQEDPEAETVRLLRRTAAELDEYFAGKRRDFTVPLAPRGTEFQRRVWEALRCIPYGQTRTYGEIARAIGAPRACRAVGMANNRNPIAILIPCHRVIGCNGSLTGYAAGIAAKERLLALERG